MGKKKGQIKMRKDLRTEYDDLQVYLDYKSGIDSVEFLSELHEIPISAVLMILNVYDSETQRQPTQQITKRNPRPRANSIVGRSGFRCTSCGADLPKEKRLWGVVWSDETQGMCKECVAHLRQEEESDDVEDIEDSIESGHRGSLSLEDEAEVVRRYQDEPGTNVRDLVEQYSITSWDFYALLDKYGIERHRPTGRKIGQGKLSAEQEAELVKLYTEEGRKTPDLASDYSITRCTVYGILRRHGAVLKSRRNLLSLSDERETELVNRYKDRNTSVIDICKEFSISKKTLNGILEKHSVEKRTKTVTLSDTEIEELIRRWRRQQESFTKIAKDYSISTQTATKLIIQYERDRDKSRKNPFPKAQRKEIEYGTQKMVGVSNFDFSNQSADGEDLSGLDLRHVNFERASLVGVDFTDSDLRGVNLKGSDIRNANFTNADLRGANLDVSNIDGVIFENTDLSNANLALIGNIVTRVHKFEGCNVDQALVTDREFIEALKYLNEKGSSWVPEEFQHISNIQGELESRLYIENSSFDGFVIRDSSFLNLNCENVSFVGTAFINCDLRGSVFWRTDLTNASFKGSKLLNVDFLNNTILRNVDFEQSNLKDAKIETESLFATTCNWNRANIDNTNFIYKESVEHIFALREEGKVFGKPSLMHSHLSSFDFRGMDLRGFDFRGADLIGADLQDCDLREANFEYTDLSGANLKGADLRDAEYNISTKGLNTKQKSVMIKAKDPWGD